MGRNIDKFPNLTGINWALNFLDRHKDHVSQVYLKTSRNPQSFKYLIELCTISFTFLEEKATIKSAFKCADWRFPLDLSEIRMLARSILMERVGR